MEFEIIEAIEVELKYCERCGGLWLRPRGATEVYCRDCTPKMAEFPEVGKKRAKCSRPAAEDLEAFCEAYAIMFGGGHA